MNTKINAIEQAQEILQAKCNDDLLNMDVSDGGNADAFAMLYGDEFLYVKELGWLHWTGKYWRQDNSAILLAMRESFDLRHDRFNRCQDETKASATKRNTYKLNAAIEQAKALLAASINDFDRNPDEINVDNGVLNLETLEVTPHDSSQRFTYCLKVPYDEQADTSVVADFMRTALTKEGEAANTELIDFMQVAMGYGLTGHTREEKLFYMYGQLGRNGKGTITEALMELMPYPLAQEVDFNTFIARRDGDSQNFDLADMKSSRMIFASESNKYQMLNPASIKKLTGGNYVRAAHKFKEFFTYRPQYKAWLSSNHKVNGDPDDDVMWGRVLVIEFPNSYMGREIKTLKELLKSPDVQRGLLRWLAIGAQKWYATGLIVPEQVMLATKKMQGELDTFSDWFEEAVKADTGAFLAYADAYQNYSVWCENNGVTAKKRTQFSESMLKRGHEAKQKRTGQIVAKGYYSLALTEEYVMVSNSKYSKAFPIASNDTEKSATTPIEPMPNYYSSLITVDDYEPDE